MGYTIALTLKANIF